MKLLAPLSLTAMTIQFFLILPLLTPTPLVATDQEVHNAIIVGSGPAGQSAALYLANAGFKPVIIGGNTGGILMSSAALENWLGQPAPTGPSVMTAGYEQIIQRGAIFLEEWVTDVDVTQKPFTVFTSSGKVLKTHVLIIATGTTPRDLECPGEKEYWGKGVTACTLCDGPLYTNKKVAVIGGGDMAMLRALFLANYTSDITIIHHSEQLSASSYWQNRLKEKPFIKTMFNTEVLKIQGDGAKVTQIMLKDKSSNTQSTFPVSGVFVAIGSKPCTDLFKGKLKTAKDGSICVCEKFTKTSVEGVFVVGNAADHGYRSAMTAAGTGVMAGLDASDYLTFVLGKDRALDTYFCCEGSRSR